MTCRHRLGALALSAALLSTRTLGAQGVIPDPADIVRRNVAPVADGAPVVRPLPIVHAELSNGLRVLILEDSRAPLVSVRLDIDGAGGLFDPAGREGLAGITAAMLGVGAAPPDSGDIAEQMDRLGATFQAAAPVGLPAATIAASGLGRNIDEWIDIFRDAALGPALPESRMIELRLQAALGMDRQRNSPGYLAEERLYAALYGAHPAARRSPTADSITALTIEAVRAWHRERYIPENAILSVFGDVESVGEGGEGGIVEWLEDRFGDWSPGAYAPPGIPRLVPPASGAIHLVDRPGSAQTTLLVGNTAIRRDDPDYPVLRLMNDLMGGGPSSRLFRAMNAGGLAVAAFSSFSALAYPGPWVLSVSVRTADTGPALEALFAEIRSIRTEPVPAEELAAAKQSTIRSFALSLEQPESVLSYAVLEEAHGLSGDYWDTYAAVLAGITADDVRGAATRYLDLDAAQVVAVGDATMMLSLLEAYGPVAVYDTQGNLLNDIE